MFQYIAVFSAIHKGIVYLCLGTNCCEIHVSHVMFLITLILFDINMTFRRAEVVMKRENIKSTVVYNRDDKCMGLS